MENSNIDAEKLARMQQASRVGGRGTPRLRTKKLVKSNLTESDQKVATAMKRLGSQPLQGITEVNMFKSDGKVLHFQKPKVSGAVKDNTFSITGNVEEKDVRDLLPDILTQLGPESADILQILAQEFKQESMDPQDEDIPNLVNKNFDEQD